MTPDIEEKDQVWDTVTSVVTEVGEANLKPYKWQEVDREGYSIYVRFETESETTYSVDLSTDKYKDTPVFLVEFSAKTKEHQGSSSRVVVNKGEMYRVMSTLTDIIKTYLKNLKKLKVSYIILLKKEMKNSVHKEITCTGHLLQKQYRV
jgi:hypothetical protein